MEFPNDDGKFMIDHYLGHNFIVNGTPLTDNVGEWRNPTQTTPATFSSTPVSSRGARRIPLAALKVIRADLGLNSKPTNTNFHNLTAHINLYTEEEACVSYVQRKVCEEMADTNLVIVGSTGLVIFDQEGTRGQSISNFLTKY